MTRDDFASESTPLPTVSLVSFLRPQKRLPHAIQKAIRNPSIPHVTKSSKLGKRATTVAGSKPKENPEISRSRSNEPSNIPSIRYVSVR